MNFFSYEYDPAVKFDMYTSMHVLMLVIALALFVLFFLFHKTIHQSAYETQIRYGYGVFLLLMLLGLIIITASGGKVFLPFHLCSISYLLSIYVLFTKDKRAWAYLFFTGIIGGLVTFAIPELDHAGYNKFRFYEFIIAHVSIMIVPLYFLLNYDYRITKKIVLFSILVTNIIGFSMLPVNLLLRTTGWIENANYMFVLGAPADVEPVFGPPPWHLLSFEFVLLVTFFGLYYLTNLYQTRHQTKIKTA